MNQTECLPNSETVSDKGSLDPFAALRVYATLMIFILHAVLITGVYVAPEHFYFKQPAWAGVWILFILSGFLIGKGFKDNRYSDKIQYLKRRFTRIGIPYYVFVFLLLLLLYPTFALDNPLAILRILTFTYDGNPGTIGLGATWFISTIMQFYIIAILFDWIVRKISKYRYGPQALTILLFVSGVIIRICLYDANVDWVKYVYTPSLTNLDLFFCGYLLNYWKSGDREKSKVESTILKSVSVVILVSVMMFFAYCSTVEGDYIVFYQYAGPSMVLLATCLYIYSFDSKAPRQKLSFDAIRKKPIRIIESFGAISFGFYLWHSNVLANVTSALMLDNTIANFLIILAISAVLTTIVSTIFYYSVEKMSARLSSRPSRARSES